MMTRLARLLVVALGTSPLSCGGQSGTPDAAAPQATSDPMAASAKLSATGPKSGPSPSSQASATANDDPRAPQPPTPVRVAAPLLRLDDVQKVIAEPVHSLALDPERGKVAALGGQAWLYDRARWQPIPLPAELLPSGGERDVARIHFGRDYLPRIMGARISATGARQLYLRYRRGAWRVEEREQAAFAGKPHAALYGVLGWDDPEVLCKVGQFCLIKQRTGWSQVPLPIAPPQTAVRIDLGNGGAYALLSRRLLRLGKKQWLPVGGEGPWKGEPGGAWIHEQGGWVTAPDERALYQHDGEGWHRHPSPVLEPRGLWSGDGKSLWVAGSSGAGYFDGRTWYRVGNIAGPLQEVIGRGPQLWFGGSGGVWSAQHPRAKLAAMK